MDKGVNWHFYKNAFYCMDKGRYYNVINIVSKFDKIFLRGYRNKKLKMVFKKNLPLVEVDKSGSVC